MLRRPARRLRRAPASSSPTGSLAPETPQYASASSGITGSSPTAQVAHAVVAPDQYIDGTSLGAASVTYRTYFGTTYADVAAGPDGPLTPSTSSSTTHTATGQSSGTKYAMTTAVVNGVEGSGQVVAYTVP